MSSGVTSESRCWCLDLVLGPDACSTLTSTNYFVQAIDSGRYFFTADIITVDFAAADGAVLNQEDPQPGIDPVAPRPIAAADEIYLPERDEQSHPAGLDLQPARRLRSKTSPAMLHRLAQASIEGEDVAHGEVHGEVHGGAPQIPRWEMEPDIFERLGRVDTPSWDRQSDEESWSLETGSSRPSSPGSLAESGGGDEEGAPNSRDGGSCPTASKNKESFLRRMQHNLHQFVMEEMSMIDATTEDQVWCMPILKEMLVKKAAVEEELNVINKEKKEVEAQAAANEFLVTKTVANKEVWDNIQDWEPSVRAEFEQLVNQKRAVRQMSKSQLQQIAREKQLPIELLPGKWSILAKPAQVPSGPEPWYVAITRTPALKKGTLVVLMDVKSGQ